MPTAPASPPKRMTRARAKAVEEKKQSTATSATKSTTARAAATKKPTAATTAATKRKAQKQDDTNDELGLESGKEEVATKAAGPVAKPKGRPRKNTVSKDPAPPTAAAPTTRTRAAAATKKKVTFKEDEDKENVNELPAKKTATKAAAGKGMDAKPVRKGVAAATTKPAAAKKSTQPRVPSPLSPKKETQVAKGNAVQQEDSDDELGQDSGPPVSPKKTANGLLSNVPAKRPPPSPYKDTMRDSPRKMQIAVPGDHEHRTEPVSPQNMLTQSPRKFNISSISKPRPLQLEGPAEMFGNSLLKSPARRPPSPIKMGLGTPGHASSHRGLDLTASVLKSRSAQRFNFSPAKNLTMAFKEAKSESNPLSNKVDTRDSDTIFADALREAPSPSTPAPVKAHTAPSPIVSEAQEDPLDEQLDHDMTEADEEMEAEQEELATEPYLDEDVVQDAATALLGSGPAFEPRATDAVDTLEEESEDELQYDDSLHRATPSVRRARLSAHFRPTPGSTITTPANKAIQQQLPFTALAEKFGEWQGATPDQSIVQQRQSERSMFSPPAQFSRLSMTEDDEATEIADSLTEVNTELDMCEANAASTAVEQSQDDDEQMADQEAPGEQRSQFDAEFEICEDDEMPDADAISEPDMFRRSQMSEASQEYGDENVAPTMPMTSLTPRVAPASVPSATVTPVSTFNVRREVAHTVSKVPLKPSADFESTPLHVAKKRRQSLSGSLTPRAQLDLQALRQVHPSASVISAEDSDAASGITTATSRIGQTLAPSHVTPRRVTTGSIVSTGLTPGRADQHLLKGIVAYVDVRTAEGAEASSIFIELLTQMGARCVKQWNWNSRASIGPDSPGSSLEEDSPSGKIGITHVVFKDGGKRTMEKVREAKGRVQCVGVGWVLDCERENRRLDEADYAVDSSLIPRGGHRRRKSMEPKSLTNLNGSLSSSSSPRKLSPPQMSPTKEFLDLATPGRGEAITVPLNDRRVSFAPGTDSYPESPATPNRDDQTPRQFATPPMPGYAESSFGSPTTPYFLHPTQLVQQTCPPKQNQELFFPVSGRIDDADENIRRRLILARRKSLQFAPKIGSPLARDE